MIRVLLTLSLLAALARPARAGDADRWDGSTMAKQVGGGLVGGAAIGSVGGIAGLLVGSSVAHSGDWGAPLVGAAIGMAVGGLIGIVGGVQIAGNHEGGDGHVLATSLGEVGGLALIGLYETILDKVKPAQRPSFFVDAGIALVAIFAGPIVGYQLSN